MRLYFENAVGRLFTPSNGYVRLEYKNGVRRLEELQAILHHASKLLELTQVNKLLCDQRHMREFTSVESQWIVQYWQKRVVEQERPLYGAILTPHNVFARLSINSLMAEAKTAALTFRTFDNEAAALAYLQVS
jgi:hypothetical protein